MVTLGLGAAAMSLGGSPGGRFTPQMELFSVEHAIFNGVALFDPSPEPPKWHPTPAPSMP
jgi:hypothetical protein